MNPRKPPKTESAFEAWQVNLKDKVQELQALLLKYLTLKDDKIADQITIRLQGLKHMFAEKRAPKVVTDLEGHLQAFRPNKDHPASFGRLMDSYQSLPTVTTFSQDDLPSFDAIFESYRDDDALTELVDKLVHLLQRILDENDEYLTAQVSRELHAILTQLKKRKTYSLYELQSWTDLAMRCLIYVVESQSGIPCLDILYEAIKLAYRVKQNLLHSYEKAQEELIDAHELPYTQKALQLVPEISSDENLQKHLPPPPANA